MIISETRTMNLWFIFVTHNTHTDRQARTTHAYLDAETLRHDGGGDELPRGHLLEQLVVGGLVEEGEVGELVTDLTLAPLLLDRNSVRQRK